MCTGKKGTYILGVAPSTLRGKLASMTYSWVMRSALHLCLMTITGMNWDRHWVLALKDRRQ